jgi:hypothetical protein
LVQNAGNVHVRLCDRSARTLPGFRRRASSGAAADAPERQIAASTCPHFGQRLDPLKCVRRQRTRRTALADEANRRDVSRQSRPCRPSSTNLNVPTPPPLFAGTEAVASSALSASIRPHFSIPPGIQRRHDVLGSSIPGTTAE